MNLLFCISQGLNGRIPSLGSVPSCLKDRAGLCFFHSVTCRRLPDIHFATYDKGTEKAVPTEGLEGSMEGLVTVLTL